MTQQQAMENILKSWVRTSNNFAVAKQQLGTNSKTAQYALMTTNGLEKILRSNGFVYRIITEQKEGEYEINYIFRAKRAKNLRKIHDNWLKKHIGWDYLTSEFKLVEL